MAFVEVVDRGERYRHAASRETREETGIVVRITHRLFTGRDRDCRVYVGTPAGGRLRFQRWDCLDVRWRDPSMTEGFELASAATTKRCSFGRTSNAEAHCRSEITRPDGGRELSTASAPHSRLSEFGNRLDYRRVARDRTPKHASWLNMAEIEFSVLTRACLKGRNPDETAL